MEADSNVGPLWAEPFRFAVVRLATYVTDRISPPSLVFGSVELLAPDRPRPVSGEVQSRKVSGNARIFFRRVAMTASEAISWYEEAGAGRLTTPLPLDPKDQSATTDGLQVSTSPLVHEPSWPALSLPLERDLLLDPSWPGSTAPFIGSGARPARLNRLMAVQDATLTSLAANSSLTEFLERRLHIDLSQYPEYRGGLVLFAPDPIARSVDMFVRPRKGQSEHLEDLVVRITPRAATALTGLELALTEVRAGSLYQYIHLDVPEDGLISLARPHQTAMAGFVLTHPVHQVLRHQAPLSFLRSVTINTKLVSRRVSIKAPVSESPTAEDESYESTEYGEDQPVFIGEQAANDLGRIFKAEEWRRRRADAERLGQRWLDEPEEARTYIRQMLAGASRRVWVVDPYLGGRQIFQFLHAVSRLSVEMRLITSRLAFQPDPEVKDSSPPASEGELQKLAMFSEGLESLTSRGVADIEGWVLPGKTPRLHDRLLVIDDNVWFSGNSLNALGSRASLILKVPNPEPILLRIAALKHEARLFEDFFRDRVNTQNE